MRRVGYVILFVRDLASSIDFYRDVVGLEPRFREHGYAEFVTEGTKFALYERRRVLGLIGREAAAREPAGEVVFEVPDADAEARRLGAAGVEIASGPVDRPWGHRTVHVVDPDGHVVEFAQRVPRARPRGDAGL